MAITKCACGCGQPTAIDSRGRYRQFVKGHRIRASTAERFWEGVLKSDGCWLWTKATANGYGYLYDHKLKKLRKATHISWELHCGPIPSGMWLLHKCDNPACVRPDHLFLGTHADNMADRDSKGRVASGSRHGWSKNPHLVLRGSKAAASKLTEDSVAEIKRRYASGGTSYRLLGIEYGVNWGTIRAVVKGRTWKHV